MSDKLIDEMNTMFEMLETLTFDADLKALVANIGNKVETTIQSYNPWHKWPEEKPTKEGYYIVANKYESWEATYKNGDWYNNILHSKINQYVTHWQPRLEPPRE